LLKNLKNGDMPPLMDQRTAATSVSHVNFFDMSGADGSRPIIRPPGLQRSSALNNDDDMDYGLPGSNLNWAPSTYYSRRTRESVLMKDFLFESPAT
jgi:hypothetical protein